MTPNAAHAVTEQETSPVQERAVQATIAPAEAPVFNVDNPKADMQVEIGAASVAVNRERMIRYTHQLRSQAGLIFGFLVSSQLNAPFRRSSDLLTVNVAICELEDILTFFQNVTHFSDQHDEDVNDYQFTENVELSLKLNDALYGSESDHSGGLVQNIDSFIGMCKKMLALQSDPNTPKDDLNDEIRNFYRIFTHILDPKCKRVIQIAERLQEMEKLHTQNEIMRKIRNATQGAHLILSLAIKSKLIALNASIEAAKISEHGKSFAVIARELQGLSLESSDISKKAQEALEELLLIFNQQG